MKPFGLEFLEPVNASTSLACNPLGGLGQGDAGGPPPDWGDPTYTGTETGYVTSLFFADTDSYGVKSDEIGWY